MVKKSKIIYEPSEKLKKRRKERRGTVKEKAEPAVEKEYEKEKRGRREGRGEGDGRRYTADRCSDDIPVKGRSLYIGKIADTKFEEMISVLKYKEV